MCVCLLCTAAQIYAQTAAVQPQAAAGTPAAAPVTAAAETGRVDETTLPIAAAQAAPAQTQNQPSTIWLFVRLVLVLALVIGAIYGIVALLKRGMNPPQKADPYLRPVASVTLGPGRSVQVITVGSQAFVIGVAENAVNLIGELNDKELIDAMNLNAEKEGEGAARDFSSLLARFLPPKKGGARPHEREAAAYFPAAADTQDFLRRRRESLRSGSETQREENDETFRP